METHSGTPDTMVAKPHVHPPYLLIFGVLFILTVAEVLVAFVANMPKVALILILLVLAVWKALLVALYYMHLKFEPKKLWIVAAVPLPLVLILIGTVLMESW